MNLCWLNVLHSFKKLIHSLTHIWYFFSFLSLQISVRVTTMDAELEFAIQPSTTGKQLFDQVCVCEFFADQFFLKNWIAFLLVAPPTLRSY